MKRMIALFLCVVMTVTLCACGNIWNVTVTDVPSELYTKEDIRSAIRVIKKDFFKEWDHDKLLSIRYAGDEHLLKSYSEGDSNEFKYWTELYHADEAIILLSDFYVSPAAANDFENTFEVDTIYEDWKWILVRDKGGQWRHVDHGYG